MIGIVLRENVYNYGRPLTFFFPIFSGIIPVAMSAIASFVSAVYVISIPAEIMYNGTMFGMQFIGYIMFTAFGAHVFIPYFMKRGQISVHQVPQPQSFRVTLLRKLERDTLELIS